MNNNTILWYIIYNLHTYPNTLRYDPAQQQYYSYIYSKNRIIKPPCVRYLLRG